MLQLAIKRTVLFLKILLSPIFPQRIMRPSPAIKRPDDFVNRLRSIHPVASSFKDVTALSSWVFRIAMFSSM